MKPTWFAGLAGAVLLAKGAIPASGIVRRAPQSAVCRTPDRSEVHIQSGTFQIGSAEYL
jgi:hypothetical protein